MKVALCLSGIVGTDGKYGFGDKTINYKIGLQHFQEHVFDVNDNVDVFLHTWSVDHEDKLIEAYKPVKCKAEPQHLFSEDTRQQAIYSRWAGVKEVLKLVQESGQEYDFILLTRYDIAFLVDFEFSKYDNNNFYVQGPPGPNMNGVKAINDLWFFSSQDKMMKFSTLYDKLGTEKYIAHKGSNHELARRHLIETGLEEDVKYVFHRGWNGQESKLNTDTPLIRWHYLRKL